MRPADGLLAVDAEFPFELQVCRWAELAWPPDGGADVPVVVARQLGTRDRRWDTVVVECDPEGLAARREFGDRELDSDLLHVVRNAPAEWAWYRDALPDPGYPWRYVRAAVHRAAGRDLVEKRRRDGRIELRRIRPYPDWVERIVAIENKPDLDASAARALADQLDHDVAAGLADEVWVASRRTGDSVQPVLLEDMPVEVGILTLDLAGGVTPDCATVDWYPSSLGPSSNGAGTGDGDGDSPADGTSDSGSTDDDTSGTGSTGDGDDTSDTGNTGEGQARRDVKTDRRFGRRLEIAERAYGRGWRSYHETMRPDCRHFELRRSGLGLLPVCAAKGRCQSAAECAGTCPDFSPEPPQWRTRGWPIEGGPGKGIKHLLGRRQARQREQ